MTCLKRSFSSLLSQDSVSTCSTLDLTIAADSARSADTDAEYEDYDDDSSTASVSVNAAEEASSRMEEDHAGDQPSAKLYESHASAINQSKIVQTNYSPSLTRTLSRLQALWSEYCKYVRPERKRRLTFKNATVGDFYGFLRWKLDRKCGKDGRKLRGTRISTSLGTDWKNFRLVYHGARKKKIDPEINRQMHQVIHMLTLDYKLSSEKREKSSMDAEDVREILQTALTTTEKRFQIGRYRILTCLFLQGAFITANRPAALTSLQYRHITVSLLRDPTGGPHRVLLEFTFEFTKTYLGAKDANTFPIPEIIFDPSLILSPHVFMLGLMFADDVFLAPTLKRPEDLNKLDIRPGCNALPIPIDPAKANDFVFRRCERDLSGWKTSADQLSANTIRPWIKKIGEIAGFLQVARPYCLRYGSGKAFDDNGNISDALRNLIMQHAKTDTFLKHYLPRRVTVDTQAIVRGLPSQNELMRASGRMSRWMNPDRPYKLTPAQSASVNDDPRIRQLIRGRDKIKRVPSLAEDCKRLGQEIANEKQRLRYALLKDIRQGWDDAQAVGDIETQLSGSGFSDVVAATLEQVDDRTPEHKRLIKAILTLPGLNLDEETRRRNDAINAVIAYCKVEEAPAQRIKPLAPAASGKVDVQGLTALENDNSHDEMLKAAKAAVVQDKRPRICFVCLANKNLPVADRAYAFGTAGDLSKHFKRKHLQHLDMLNPIECHLCEVTLEHRMHFQNHAYTVHGTVS